MDILEDKKYSHFTILLSLSRKHFLQAVAADSFVKVGSQILISNGIAIISGQAAAIDPLGHFVIYIGGSGFTTLLFQAIDALGNPSGQPKIISNNIMSGIDILKD